MLAIPLYARVGQLFSSAGHIVSLVVSHGPIFSKKKLLSSYKIAFCRPYVVYTLLFYADKCLVTIINVFELLKLSNTLHILHRNLQCVSPILASYIWFVLSQFSLLPQQPPNVNLDTKIVKHDIKK